MFSKSMSLLKEIVSMYPLSGNEELLNNFLKKKLESATCSVKIDEAGNLICKKGNDSNSFAIFVHADRVGFMVSKVKPVVQVVGLSPEVETSIKDKEKYNTVGIDHSGGELYSVTLEKSPSGKTMILTGKEKKLAKIGDYVAYMNHYQEDEKTISSPGLDNALGIVTGIELFKTIKTGTLVVTVQEEMGFFGAISVAKNNNFEKVCVIDATYADDSSSAVSAGKGVSFCVKDKNFADKKMLDYFINIAEVNKIKYQLEVIGTGGSDYSGIASIWGIVPHIFVGIPIVNMHSSCETVCKSDFYATIEFVRKLGENGFV